MPLPTFENLATRHPEWLASILQKLPAIHEWYSRYEHSNELPIYSSVDIRDSGFKAAVVDANLFPAGFNNLCPHGIEDAAAHMRTAILKRVANAEHILIIIEEHTRNTWYLENARILQDIIEAAGFKVTIATFLTIQPDFCDKAKFVEFETATGHAVRMYCLNNLLDRFEKGQIKLDMIIMNNDLTVGIPPILANAKIPIYPSLKAGWHSRLKSHHFQHAQGLINEFGQIIGLDPWIFSALFTFADRIDINSDADRQRLQDLASDLMNKISLKYAEHAIEEKPYIVLKSDSGTYGMGVMAFEDPADIAHLNRKGRNKLNKGKSSKANTQYLLQEGISTIYHIDNKVSEACIYQIDNNLIGGFFRSHADKNQRQSLNAVGMNFSKMCPHEDKYSDCQCCIRKQIGIFDLYRILARIAGIAAHREIIQLEAGLS